MTVVLPLKKNLIKKIKIKGPRSTYESYITEDGKEWYNLWDEEDPEKIKDNFFKYFHVPSEEVKKELLKLSRNFWKWFAINIKIQPPPELIEIELNEELNE